MKAKTKMKTAKYAAGGANDNPIKDYLQKQKDKKTAANKAALSGKSTTPNPKLYDPRLDKPKKPDTVMNASQDAKNTKKQGKIGQVISRIKSNIQERKSERERVKEYKKKPKMESFKTGGMANSNAKVLASTVAKGTVGGSSVAPKGAVPKAKYGTSMRGKKSC
jgi:Mrp family chromosome partitioning ATPase